MVGDWVMVALGVLLTAGTAVFVASEFSLVTLDPGVVECQTRPDDRREPGRFGDVFDRCALLAR